MTVNHGVPGSSPGEGATRILLTLCVGGIFCFCVITLFELKWAKFACSPANYLQILG